MKKIMFNDRYGLTEAVLSGRKTQTRRIITCHKEFKGEWVAGFYVYTRQSDNAIINWPCMYNADERAFDGGEILPKYKVGEVVAVAMSYKTVVEHLAKKSYDVAKWLDDHNITSNLAGWLNKMFVTAGLMPYRIRITDVRVERLQDISDEDCIKEGVREVCVNNNWGNCASRWEFQIPYEDKLGRTKLLRGTTPREVFAILIDRISGNGVFQSNPYVFVYDFVLEK